MTDTNPSRWIGRIIFWLLGTALFLSISLLPNLLLAWFYTGGRVHAIVTPTVGVILLLIWASSKLTPTAAQ